MLVGRTVRGADVDSVLIDDRHGTELVLEHLVGLGHERIAHVDGGRAPGGPQRRSAYLRGMRTRRLAAHELFGGTDVIADNRFHRSELLGPAALIPGKWMEESCALGSVSACVESLRQFREAGADEIVTYGSTPGQNAELARAWTAARSQTSSRASQSLRRSSTTMAR